MDQDGAFEDSGNTFSTYLQKLKVTVCVCLLRAQYKFLPSVSPAVGGSNMPSNAAMHQRRERDGELSNMVINNA